MKKNNTQNSTVYMQVECVMPLSARQYGFPGQVEYRKRFQKIENVFSFSPLALQGRSCSSWHSYPQRMRHTPPPRSSRLFFCFFRFIKPRPILAISASKSQNHDNNPCKQPVRGRRSRSGGGRGQLHAYVRQRW